MQQHRWWWWWWWGGGGGLSGGGWREEAPPKQKNTTPHLGMARVGSISKGFAARVCNKEVIQTVWDCGDLVRRRLKLILVLAHGPRVGPQRRVDYEDYSEADEGPEDQ